MDSDHIKKLKSFICQKKILKKEKALGLGIETLIFLIGKR
jgi:hypothetical protein